MIDTDVVIMPGACINTPRDVNDMQEQTAAGLRELVGDRLRGEINHRHWHGRVACQMALRALYADDDRLIARFGLDQFEAFFDEYPDDCVLVVANAPAVQP